MVDVDVVGILGLSIADVDIALRRFLSKAVWDLL